MTKRVFIWVAHPRLGSLCSGLADSYQAGAARRGAEIRRLDLGAMAFGTDFTGYGPDAPPLEPDLLAWQENIRWADHLLIIHPCWWGALPTRAKAVLDRALAPGFGFKYHQRGVKWDRLLTGKTADVVITSDTPPLLDTVLYHQSTRRVLRSQVLDFCGVKTRAVVQFGSVKTAEPETIARWLRRADRLGARAAA